MQACPANNAPSKAHAVVLEARAAVLPVPAVPARTLAPGAMTLFSVAGAILIAASSSAATPLYRLYQQSMHLTPFWITIVFAVYVASLLVALLTVGGLSDYVGRRPVMLAALVLNAAMLLSRKLRMSGS